MGSQILITAPFFHGTLSQSHHIVGGWPLSSLRECSISARQGWWCLGKSEKRDCWGHQGGRLGTNDRRYLSPATYRYVRYCKKRPTGLDYSCFYILFSMVASMLPSAFCRKTKTQKLFLSGSFITCDCLGV